ncbi:nickel-dependent lactate racemase [Dendrosporobacter sp. 1207_IL3150]|uniref:nickel-dependent lactate racemase n=1 Tax=Dendrosporobacter sp. 1207_IL3150 TaxID=3084054 RepID=UPI002FD8E313
MTKIELGLGKEVVSISLPEEKVSEIIEGRPYEPVTDIESAVKLALRNPIGTLPLKDVVKAGDKVAIVASDITRAWLKHSQFLPFIINELNEAGVPDCDISLVVALGAHRLHTHEENISVYGKEVVDRIRIVQSYAPNEEDFIEVGTTTRGVTAKINKEIVNADKVIITGGIVYHLMAGFGGGRKAIVPGVAAYSTIQGNHRYCLHEDAGGGVNPFCGSGYLKGNPMQEDMTEMAAMVNPAFLFNVVLNAEGKFARFVAGHWLEAWQEGCKTVSEIFGVPIAQKADLVIASAGGYPKDINLYQGAKTIDNAALACKDDGVVVLLLECADIAEPPDFSEWFEYEDLQERERVLRQGFTVPGFVALKLGVMAKRIPHIVVTLPQNKQFIEKAGMIYAASIDDAMALAQEKLGGRDYKAIIMPHAANTVPIVKE